MRNQYLSLLILLAVLFTLTSATEPKIRLLQPGDAEIDLQDTKHSLFIPLLLDKSLENKKISIKVASVKRGNKIIPSLRAAFIPSITGSDLTIKFQLPNLPGAGKYELILRFKQPELGLSEYLTLLVLYPEGTLKAPSSLTIGMTSYLFWDCVKEAPLLSLSESGGESKISNLSLPPIYFSGNRSQQYQINFDNSFLTLLPKQSANVRYAVEGKFPLGNHAATYYLTTPGLGNQQSILVEVRNRLSSLFILPFLIAGIVVGFLLRKVLGARKVMAGYRVQCSRFIRDIEDAQLQNPDAVFQQACDRVKAEVVKKMDDLQIKPFSSTNETFQAFEKTIQDANNNLNTALQDLQHRRDELKSQLEALLATLSENYDLPDHMLLQLKQQHQQTSSIQKDLKKGLIAKGKISLTNLLENTSEILEGLLMAYRKNQKEFGVLPDRLPLPADVLQPLQEAVKKIRDSPLTVSDLQKDAAQLRSQLEEWSKHYNSWRTDVLCYTNTLEAYFRELYQRLTRIAPDRPELTVLNNSITAYSGPLHSTDIYVDPNRNVLDVEILSSFDMPWYQFIAGLTNEPTKEFKECLDQRDYMGALNKLLRSLEGIGLGSAFKPPFIPPPARPVKEAAPVINLEAFTPVLQLRMEEQKQEKLEILEGLVNMVLICLAGYFFFEKDFVGTVSQLISIFFWGLGLDMTANTLTEATKKVVNV